MSSPHPIDGQLGVEQAENRRKKVDGTFFFA
jgi:hypothetical protein